MLISNSNIPPTTQSPHILVSLLLSLHVCQVHPWTRVIHLRKEKYSPYCHLTSSVSSCATDLIDTAEHKKHESAYSSFRWCLVKWKSMLWHHLFKGRGWGPTCGADETVRTSTWLVEFPVQRRGSRLSAPHAMWERWRQQVQDSSRTPYCFESHCFPLVFISPKWQSTLLLF